MVDVIGMDLPVGQWTSGVLDLLFYVFLFAIMGAIFFFVWKMASYNINFVVRSLAKDRKIIKITKAKKVVNKDGTTYLSVRGFSKLHAQIPPVEAIELTSKGKKFVEAYLTENDEFIYLTDQNKDIPSFQPLTSSQRVLAVHELFKARQDSGFAWNEHIGAIVGGMTVIILVALLVISWESVWEPMERMGSKFDNMITSMEQITERQYQISTGKQVIRDEPITPEEAGG